MIYDKVTLTPNKYGDTRTAPRHATFRKVLQASVSHREEVRDVMYLLSGELRQQGKDHDWTKIVDSKQFFKDFKVTIKYGDDFTKGKIYIGITSQRPKDRFDNGNGYKTNPMKNACKKYGWENIKHEILAEHLTQEQAEKMEIELIAKYNSTDIKIGYNIAKGGKSSSGCKHSEETKHKMSLSHKGKIVSDETREKMSKWQREDLTNKKFGRLTALYPFRKNGRLWWHCLCECGNKCNVRKDHLKYGEIQSCGCLGMEKRTETIRRVNNERKKCINVN